MFCKYCGKEIAENSKFCPECGANLEAEAANTEFASATPAEEEPKVWTVFATLSHIFGIISLAACWLFAGWVLGVPGIIFGCLGKKASNKETKEKAAKGIKRSIAGLVLSTVFYIVIVIIVAIITAIASSVE